MITITDLRFDYHDHNRLFENFALKIKKTGVIGLLGKNGAGKSTLLNLIAGLLIPKKGHCLVLDYHAYKREPQFLMNLYYLPELLFVPALTITKYINYIAPFYPQFDYKLLKHCFNEFNLPQTQSLNNLSYGEKKKFLIAFGIATNTKILLLDEPTNGLDVPSKQQFQKLISTTSQNKLVIVSTHQTHDIENLIDSVMVLAQGENIFYQSLIKIARHLSFSCQQNKPEHIECIYSDRQFNGYATIKFNREETLNPINLETLFNAVINNQSVFKEIFKTASSTLES